MEEVEPAAEVIRRHPEVKRVVLEWVIPFHTICKEGHGCIVESVGTAFSWNQCISGNRYEAIRTLPGCECWNGLITDEAIREHLYEGTLRIRHTEETEDPYTTYTPPQFAEVNKRILRGGKMPETSEEIAYNRAFNRR